MIDIFIIIPIVLGFVFGLSKGLIKELFALAAIVLGIFGARLFEPQVSQMLLSVFDMQVGVARAISYLILFVAIAVALLFVANLLDKLVSAIALGGLNKLLGAVFGMLKMTLIVSVLLNVFDKIDQKQKIISEETKTKSFTYKPMLNFAPKMWNEAKDFLFEQENEQENKNNDRKFASAIF
jgi:membrane protein required for colicin V production